MQYRLLWKNWILSCISGRELTYGELTNITSNVIASNSTDTCSLELPPNKETIRYMFLLFEDYVSVWQVNASMCICLKWSHSVYQLKTAHACHLTHIWAVQLITSRQTTINKYNYFNWHISYKGIKIYNQVIHKLFYWSSDCT